MKNQKLNLDVDRESVHIFRNIGEDEEPLHIAYWHKDEWIEDPEIVSSIITAVQLYYVDQKSLLETLGMQEYKL